MDAQANQNKMVLLAKLAFHYWSPKLSEAEEKHRWDDYLSDLEAFSVYQVQLACAEWRRSAETHFPTPGQLIEKIRHSGAASIGAARGTAPPHKAAQIVDDSARYPYQHRPWRDILRANGRPIPADGSPLAMQLDQLQRRPARDDA
jgi:hypothetical protein